MVFEQDRIARGRPTMGAKPEGDNLGSFLALEGMYQHRLNLRVLAQYIF
jgi:hypothetical protein